MYPRTELLAYRVALIIAMTMVGYLTAEVFKERSRVCNTRIIVPSSYCYTWSDGYQQCRKPKEIDV